MDGGGEVINKQQRLGADNAVESSIADCIAMAEIGGYGACGIVLIKIEDVGFCELLAAKALCIFVIANFQYGAAYCIPVFLEEFLNIVTVNAFSTMPAESWPVRRQSPEFGEIRYPVEWKQLAPEILTLRAQPFAQGGAGCVSVFPRCPRKRVAFLIGSALYPILCYCRWPQSAQRLAASIVANTSRIADICNLAE